MICSKCKPIDDKRKKSNMTVKGIVQCQIANCTNVTNILNYTCGSCSEEYNLCEICGYTIDSKNR